jgi:hypothetical protein
MRENLTISKRLTENFNEGLRKKVCALRFECVFGNCFSLIVSNRQAKYEMLIKMTDFIMRDANHKNVC